MLGDGELSDRELKGQPQRRWKDGVSALVNAADVQDRDGVLVEGKRAPERNTIPSVPMWNGRKARSHAKRSAPLLHHSAHTNSTLRKPPLLSRARAQFYASIDAFRVRFASESASVTTGSRDW